MLESLQDRLRRAYDSNAAERDARILPDWKLEEREGVLQHFEHAQVRTILEIGAGAGHDADFFATRGFDVTCVDLSPEMVQCCRSKGLAAHVMDASRLSLDSDSFDAVYSVNCLLHVPRAERPNVLGEIHRVMKPGGLFYYGTWGGFDHEGVYEDDHLDPPRLFSFHTDDDLKRIVCGTFELLEFRSVARDPEDPRFRFQSLLLRRATI